MKQTKNFFFSFLPFLMMMAVLFFVPNALYMGLTFFCVLIDPYNGAYNAYLLFNEHLELITCIMYLTALVPAGFWYYKQFYKKRTIRHSKRFLSLSSVSQIALLTLGVSHAITLLFVLIAAISPDTLDNYNQMMEASGVTSYSLIWFIGTILLPPLVEELIFRGLTLRLFCAAKVPFVAANLLQAFLFGVFHMNLVQGIYAFLIGLLMGYLVKRYHTLLAGMTFHACFNLFGTLLSDLEGQYLSDGLYILFTFLGLILAVVMLYRISRGPAKSQSLGTPVLRQSPYETY